MGTLSLVLWLTISVLISAVIDRFVPRVSLPLIQVVMGVVIAMAAGNVVYVALDPDLFLVLFIAPLLYIEAKDADKALLWRNRGAIISLAVGLVVVSTLIIGFSVNAIIPAIPLAAAFALGAALGPTDAVAVTSLSKQVSIPERMWGMLKGELLLNDASGIVSFQFALAAVITGTFSLFNASVTFLYEFIGGLLFGLVLGYLANFILRKIRDLGIESTTFHTLYELCIPFIVYLSANTLHVSGIIAVVVAGLVNVIAPRTVSPSIAHMNIVSSSVWQVVSFTLNGIVFVLLGTQIPTSMYYTWLSPDLDNVMLIVYILIVTAILMGVRFLWCIGMEYVHCRRANVPFTKTSVRDVATLTLCGSKGTITLSILFTIPFYITSGEAFPSRNLIIFIGCGVILCTLLIANFCVPLVCPKKKRGKSEIAARQNYYETLNDILRNVIEELTAQQNSTNTLATNKVIKIYQIRIENTKDEINIETDSNIELRIQAYKWEQEYAQLAMEEGKFPHDVCLEFISRLDKLEKLTQHRDDRSWTTRAYALIRLTIALAQRVISRLIARLRRTPVLPSSEDPMRDLQYEANQYVMDKLRGLVASDDVQTEDASRLLVSYEQRSINLAGKSPSVTRSFKIQDESDDIKRLAYQLELEQIQKMYEQDRITRQEANRMRDNVQIMQMDLDDRI